MFSNSLYSNGLHLNSCQNGNEEKKGQSRRFPAGPFIAFSEQVTRNYTRRVLRPASCDQSHTWWIDSRCVRPENRVVLARPLIALRALCPWDTLSCQRSFRRLSHRAATFMYATERTMWHASWHSHDHCPVTHARCEMSPRRSPLVAAACVVHGMCIRPPIAYNLLYNTIIN